MLYILVDQMQSSDICPPASSWKYPEMARSGAEVLRHNTRNAGEDFSYVIGDTRHQY
jgi:hypothetical protein